MSADCPECKVGLANVATGGHLRGCSKFAEYPKVPYDKTGFVRNERGGIAGLNEHVAEPFRSSLNLFAGMVV